MTFLSSRRLESMRATCGFTLLELLVVMTLLSLLMTGLISAFRTMAQTEGKIDQRLSRLDELRVARGFLLQTLSRVSAEEVVIAGTPDPTMVPFFATSNELAWIGIMPGRPNVGGKYHFRLSIEELNARRELILRYQLFNSDEEVPVWENAEYRILISDVNAFEVQTEGLPPKGHIKEKLWPNGWQSGWPLTDTLPERVKFKLIDAHLQKFEWVFPIFSLPHSDSSFNEVVV